MKNYHCSIVEVNDFSVLSRFIRFDRSHTPFSSGFVISLWFLLLFFFFFFLFFFVFFFLFFFFMGNHFFFDLKGFDFCWFFDVSFSFRERFVCIQMLLMGVFVIFINGLNFQVGKYIVIISFGRMG